MRDPIEKLQESETFQHLDQRLNWAMVTIFGVVAILIVVAVVKNVLLA